MNYGLPYMGSKNRIAEKIVEILPRAEVLVDLFAGGCAITHRALISGKFKRIITNDIGMGPKMFVDAINGKYKDEKRWISCEDFKALKNSDPYVKFCFSFGNNGNSYMYNTKIEPYKRACHYAVVFDEWADFETLCPEVSEAAKTALNGIENTKQRRLAFGPAIVKELKRIGDWNLVQNNPLYNSCHKRQSLKSLERLKSLESLPSLECLERLKSLERLESLPSLECLERLKSLERLESLKSIESLERLESLKSLERLERLKSIESLQSDYRDVEIPAGAIVYCDPPYKGTYGYGVEFDADGFREWALNSPHPIFVSEYEMPDGFMLIKKIEHRSILCSTANNVVTERLYANPAAVEKYKLTKFVSQEQYSLF